MRLFCGADRQRYGADPGDGAGEGIAGSHRPDTFRRAGVNEIARMQMVERREVRDDLRHFVNQLRDVAVRRALA